MTTSRLDRPPRPLLEWVADRAGSKVVTSQPLVGGISSLILRCDLADGRQVVVRQIEDEAWLEREPTIIAQEATALRLLEQSPLSTPRLIGSDVDAGRLIMSFLPGHMRVAPDDIDDSVEAMAAAATAIAATPLAEGHGLPTYRPWVPAELGSPTWGDPSLWAAVIELYQHRQAELNIAELGWAAGCQPVLLHRDLHPLNMLWPEHDAKSGGQPSVVDWLNACVGHPHAELGHCRWNLSVLVGTEAAEKFLGHYLRLAPSTTGTDYDPLWDVVVLLSVSHDGGSMAGEGWRAAGRNDLSGSIVVEATERFARVVLDRAQHWTTD